MEVASQLVLAGHQSDSEEVEVEVGTVEGWWGAAAAKASDSLVHGMEVEVSGGFSCCKIGLWKGTLGSEGCEGG